MKDTNVNNVIETKGLTKRQAIYRHAMRNSMVVIFPSILSEFISVLSGSLIIESMFGLNGLGKFYITALNTKDYEVAMALQMFYVILGLIGNLIIDLAYGLVDPRVRVNK